MTSYEQNCRKIAEEMARKSWTGATKWDAIHDKEKYIKFEIVNARIAVKHMADSFRLGFMYNLDVSPDEPGYQHKMLHLELTLRNLGLIPSPENKEQ